MEVESEGRNLLLGVAAAEVAPEDVIILSLAAGLAVVEAVHEVTGLWGDLRWPNDVLLGGRNSAAS